MSSQNSTLIIQKSHVSNAGQADSWIVAVKIGVGMKSPLGGRGII
jgi:hypothetical protein